MENKETFWHTMTYACSVHTVILWIPYVKQNTIESPIECNTYHIPTRMYNIPIGLCQSYDNDNTRSEKE